MTEVPHVVSLHALILTFMVLCTEFCAHRFHRRYLLSVAVGSCWGFSHVAVTWPITFVRDCLWKLHLFDLLPHFQSASCFYADLWHPGSCGAWSLLEAFDLIPLDFKSVLHNYIHVIYLSGKQRVNRVLVCLSHTYNYLCEGQYIMCLCVQFCVCTYRKCF